MIALKDVLFVGGAWPKLASVQIRCVDIAKYLGCDYVVNLTSIDDIPQNYRCFVCVKPRLSEADIGALARRGVVVWDIIDVDPPWTSAPLFPLASTQTVADFYKDQGTAVVIPHYHCNFSGNLERAAGCQIGWVGQRHWAPSLTGIDCQWHFVDGLTAARVSEIYSTIGISLNVRADIAGAEHHRRVNAGIKLINCIGFGIPSISSREPPYLELDDGCTLFTDGNDLPALAERLRSDADLYDKLRRQCIANADRYCIASIAKRYLKLFGSL